MTKSQISLHSKTVDDAMRLFELQAALFGEKPSRLALTQVNIPDFVGENLTVNVWRNHSFEPLIPLINPYMLFGGINFNFKIGDYDDSLTFYGHQASAAELLWLDSRRFLERLNFDDWLDWLKDRVHFLRSISTSPIIIATWLENDNHRKKLHSMIDGLPAVYFAEISSVCEQAKVSLIDDRSANLAGTPLSSAAQVIISRVLACHWLPAALVPPVKAIALDLDHTLHAGVLGEEGIWGVHLTDGHIALQNFIKSLQQRGIFIALVSRNEPSDVEALFAQRSDYPLRWEDFSVTEVSWGDKATAIEKIASNLRISTDAVLFVDDNPGELVSVIQRLPNIHAIHANSDATLTCNAINYYPGLWRWKVEADDAKRINDLKANAERESIAEQVSNPVEYFQSLKVTLTFRQNPREQLSRLSDLCNKTNQFNLAMRRFNEAEISERLDSLKADVASVQLSDRLSDSGVIAVIVAERQGTHLVIEELCVSCRAMGRHLEDSLILSAIRMMPNFKGCEDVGFRVQHGPRNQPALNWLTSLIGENEIPSPGLHFVPASRIQEFKAVDGVTLII